MRIFGVMAFALGMTAAGDDGIVLRSGVEHCLDRHEYVGGGVHFGAHVSEWERETVEPDGAAGDVGGELYFVGRLRAGCTALGRRSR